MGIHFLTKDQSREEYEQVAQRAREARVRSLQEDFERERERAEFSAAGRVAEVVHHDREPADVEGRRRRCWFLFDGLRARRAHRRAAAGSFSTGSSPAALRPINPSYDSPSQKLPSALPASAAPAKPSTAAASFPLS